MRGKQQSRSRAELMRGELSESLEHAKRAAGYAAQGIQTTVSERMGSARARNGGRAGMRRNLIRMIPMTGLGRAMVGRGRKQAKRAGPGLGGLLIGGMVVGIVIAMLRRRRQQEWEARSLEESLEASEFIEPEFPAATAPGRQEPGTPGVGAGTSSAARPGEAAGAPRPPGGGQHPTG